MGLNLLALNNLAALAIKPKEESREQQNEQASAATVSKQQEEAAPGSQSIHSATSKSTEVLLSLVGLESKTTSAAPASKSVDQSGIVSATSTEVSDPKEVIKQIKYQEISDTIVGLREAIHGAHPKMPGLLQEIWKTLQSYQEQVTLLSEDQMEIIISGLEKVVDTDLANLTIKAATSGKGKKGPVSLDTLGF